MNLRQTKKFLSQKICLFSHFFCFFLFYLMKYFPKIQKNFFYSMNEFNLVFVCRLMNLQKNKNSVIKLILTQKHKLRQKAHFASTFLKLMNYSNGFFDLWFNVRYKSFFVTLLILQLNF